MMFFKMIFNPGIVFDLLKSVRDLIQYVAVHKERPSQEVVKRFLDCLIVALEKEVIDIPALDEKALAVAIKELEDRIWKAST